MGDGGEGGYKDGGNGVGVGYDLQGSHVVSVLICE